MKTSLKWTDGMSFEAVAEPHLVNMDAKTPLGKNSAPTPKELVVMGLAGCTAMDVIALMKKYRQKVTSFQVNAEVSTSQNVHPAVFTKAILEYVLNGNIEAERALEAIRLSQTQYCGVSAMLCKAFPIEWKLKLNGEEIGSGQAKFEN